MLKATSAIAGAKLATIAISIVRTKIIAVLLGPGGMGLINSVSSSIDLARVIFSFGLDGITVRRVAESGIENNSGNLDLTYRIAIRTALCIGLFSCLIFTLASPLLSLKFLGNWNSFGWFAVAGCSLIFAPLLGVQLAFLQGLKQSRALATCQIFASLAGTVCTIALVSLFGKFGGVVALLPVAILSLVVHHRFLTRFRPRVNEKKSFHLPTEARSLIRQGSGFAINGIWLVASGWLNLYFIHHYYGAEKAVFQVGLYGAASMLASFYISIIISSMGTEFYPGLVQTAGNKPAMSRLLNQQTVLSICIGVPASLGLMIMAPWVLSFLYTSEFIPGSDLMRWMLAGMAIRFISCPLGYTLLAAASPRLIALSEICMGITMIVSSYVMLQLFGLFGLGIALLFSNVLYLVGILVLVKRMKVSWNLATTTFILESSAVMGTCLALCLLLPGIKGVASASVVCACYSVHVAFMFRTEISALISKISRKFIR